MRVLAIGATGFIGRHVVNQLVLAEHEVTVFHRGDTEGNVAESVRHMRGDRDDLRKARGRLERLAPDVVIDVVPYTEAQAQDLVQAFDGIAGRIVAVSSADVYRNYDGLCGETTVPPDPTPLAEDAPLREKLYPYRGHDIEFRYREEYDKILVEREVLNQGNLPGTIIRLPAVYGPGDRQHRLRQHLRQMDAGQSEILLDERQAGWRWTRGYVEDVAAGIALAVMHSRAAGRVYNVGEAQALTEREWIERIGDVAGWSGRVIDLPFEQVPDDLKQPFDWRYELAIDTGRIREELGYREKRSQSEALASTIEWERAHPGYAAQDNSAV
jgi:nucleoside-diphosphate-sugar epimerase